MSFRADFYEAMTWLALEHVYSATVHYEPERKLHSENIYTIPDFLVATIPPHFFHVCYWDSKETSHAKFWRTISELVDLKRYIPNCWSTCVVFEASLNAGKYSSAGWYPDFLHAFRELFDSTVLFDDPSLLLDLKMAESLSVGGTSRIFKVVREKKARLKSLDSLKAAFRKPLIPKIVGTKTRRELWTTERAFVPSITPTTYVPSDFGRLRNAMLQCVLILLLLPKKISAQELLTKLRVWREGVRESRDVPVLKILRTLPIDYRLGQFSVLLGIEEDLCGDTKVIFSEDITLFLDALRVGIQGLSESAICDGIDRTTHLFAQTLQVMEAIMSIKSVAAIPDISVLRKMTAAKLWDSYTAVPTAAKYNIIAELIIEASGLGTYPLARRINQAKPGLNASRNDIRGLYGNKRSTANSGRYAQILAEMAKLIPAGLDSATLTRRYLLRKTHRIIGPQSAINPLEELVQAILTSCPLGSGVKVISNTELPTLIGDCVESAQAGSWRCSLALQRDSEFFPIFMSGMKGPADCGHKTREFCGHLAMARYRLRNGKIVSSSVKRGLAILDGSYGTKEGKAFELAGFAVCSIAGITSALQRLGLLKEKLEAVPIPVPVDDLAMAAEPEKIPKLSKRNGNGNK